MFGVDIHASVYNKRADFAFPIVNFPGMSCDIPRLPSYSIYISELIRFESWCTSVLDLQITSIAKTRGYINTQFFH